MFELEDLTQLRSQKMKFDQLPIVIAKIGYDKFGNYCV